MKWSYQKKIHSKQDDKKYTYTHQIQREKREKKKRNRRNQNKSIETNKRIWRNKQRNSERERQTERNGLSFFPASWHLNFETTKKYSLCQYFCFSSLDQIIRIG